MKQILQDILPLIEKAAPAVAKALGLNALGSAAPWALYLISKAFGLNLNEVEKLPQAIIEDPESEKKLQQIEDSFADWFMDNTRLLTKNIKVSDLEIHFKLSFEPSSQIDATT
jgi:hypothetical protein